MARKLVLLVMLICSGCLSRAQSGGQPGGGDETAVRQAVAAQAEAWNRGDVEGFMKVYEDSPQTTFIGTSVRKGYKPILERYKQGYATRAQMGTLTFNDLDVRLVPNGCGKTEIALVTGKFHLQRTEKGTATKDDGIFSLVFRKGTHGWKIILDHTS